MIMRKKRHPFRGIFFGLLFGIGLALMAMVYGWYFLGPLTPWILLLLAIVLGLVLAFVPRPWGGRRQTIVTS
jgi:hypothetical protein